MVENWVPEWAPGGELTTPGVWGQETVKLQQPHVPTEPFNLRKAACQWNERVSGKNLACPIEKNARVATISFFRVQVLFKS